MTRPDASMSLLTDLQANALEPEYHTTAPAPINRPRLLFTLALIALLLTVAALQTTRGAGADAQNRQDLLDRLASAQERQQDLANRVAALDQEIGELGKEALGDPAQRQRLADLELAVGATAVQGPGIVVVVNDAPDASNTRGLVLDSDLSRLINGLWAAGAEAISINGRRVTALTPIRSAGAAITVDYVSLSPPYQVEAIGDPATLPARFNQTQAASWWHFLSQNYGVTMAVTQSKDDLELPSDPGLTLRLAEPN